MGLFGFVCWTGLSVLGDGEKMLEMTGSVASAYRFFFFFFPFHVVQMVL